MVDLEDIDFKKSIPQTCRTLIVEEYNNDLKDPADLATIFRNFDSEIESWDDIHEPIQKLVVHSFNEFLEKFCPTIYEGCFRTEQGGFEFNYSTKREDMGTSVVTSYRLDASSYYKMLEDVYRSRRDVNQANLLIDDSKLLAYLTPQHAVERVKNVRKDMEYACERYHELEKRGENADKWARKIREYRKEIQKQAKYPVHLLPVAIEDAKVKIELCKQLIEADVASSQGGGGSGQGGMKQLVGKLGKPGFAEDGSLIILEIPSEQTGKELTSGSQSSDNGGADKSLLSVQIRDVVSKDIAVVEGISCNQFVRDLIVKSYAPYAPLEENENKKFDNKSVEELKEELEKLEKQKAQYEKVYTAAQNKFIRVMSRLIEKMLGVYSFFDHATSTGGKDGRVSEGVIIANCSAEKLVAVRNNFSEYIKSMPEEYAIWFAVLPAVYLSVPSDASQKGKVNAFGKLNENSNEEKSKESLSDPALSYTDWGKAKEFLSVMKDAKIVTIFNFKGEKENSFSGISQRRLEEYRGLVGELNDETAEYAVLAYPSFTLLRERDIPVDKEKIKYEGIYIDAAYPAAGLLVASQRIEVLKSKKLAVNPKNHGVYVNLEDESLLKAFQTHFNKQNLYNWKDEIRNEITKDSFGFSFCSDELFVGGGEKVHNAYILTARTLRRNKQEFCIPIRQVMLKNFIRRFLKSRNFTEKKLNDFIKKKIVGEWIAEAKSNDQNDRNSRILNPMIGQGDKVEIKNRKVTIIFGEDESVIDDVEVVSE